MGLPNIGPLELIIILAVLLLVVGPRRLPEMGQAFGRTIREFRKASTEMTDAATISTDTKTPASSATTEVQAPAVPAPGALAPGAPAQSLPAASAAALPDEPALAAPLQPQGPAPDPGTDTTDDASRQA